MWDILQDNLTISLDSQCHKNQGKTKGDSGNLKTKYNVVPGLAHETEREY